MPISVSDKIAGFWCEALFFAKAREVPRTRRRISELTGRRKKLLFANAKVSRKGDEEKSSRQCFKPRTLVFWPYLEL